MNGFIQNEDFVWGLTMTSDIQSFIQKPQLKLQMLKKNNPSSYITILRYFGPIFNLIVLWLYIFFFLSWWLFS